MKVTLARNKELEFFPLLILFCLLMPGLPGSLQLVNVSSLSAGVKLNLAIASLVLVQ